MNKTYFHFLRNSLKFLNIKKVFLIGMYGLEGQFRCQLMLITKTDHGSFLWIMLIRVKKEMFVDN